MAQKRMFTMKIVDSDNFLNMSANSQAIYFQLCMRSDNNGRLRRWKRIFQIISINEKDVSELIENEYLKKRQMVYMNYLCLKRPQDMENKKKEGTQKNIKNGEKEFWNAINTFARCAEAQTQT